MERAAFSGNMAHTLDPKGRVTIPTAFREALGERFTIGLNRQFSAVALYPAEKWAQICAELDTIPDYDAKGMRYVRLILGSSFTDCELDGQGRVLVPAPLREKVGLDKAIRFVGVGRFLEVWDDARFQRENGAAEEGAGDLLAYASKTFFGARVLPSEGRE